MPKTQGRVRRVPPPLREMRTRYRALRQRRQSRRRYHESQAIIGTFPAALRLWIRGSLIGLSLVFVWILWMATAPIGWITRWHRRPIRRALLRVWGHFVLWIMNVRVEVTGTPPKPPYFLVCNHLSYVDTFVLCHQLGPVFIAMAEMSTWPLMGRMMRTSQQLFIDRNASRDVARALASIHQVLDEDDGIIVFAEARCSRGITVLPFKPALIEAAAMRHTPVHYATLSYRTPPGTPAAGDAVVWWRWESFGPHANRLLRLPGFTATVHFGDQLVPASNRKVMARQLHEAVMQKFVPIQQGVLPELPAPPDVPKVYGESE